MFNPDKTFATVKHIAEVIKELGHVFDVLSVKILENRKRIMALETRIKEMDKKWNIAKVQVAMSIKLKIE